MFAEDDVYPALAMTRILRDVWAEDFQIRLGLSETVARPDLREISGSSFIDPLTETRIRGNPELVTSAIEQLRLARRVVLRERRQLHGLLVLQGHREPDRDRASRRHRRRYFADVHECGVGDVSGVEVEWLKDLSSFGWDFLDPFFFSGNLTLHDSELTVGDVGVQPDEQRAADVAALGIRGQPQLGFDSRRTARTRLRWPTTRSASGCSSRARRAPDAYEQPFDSLDFVYSFFPTERVSMSSGIQNLLDEELEIEQTRHRRARAERRHDGQDRRQVGPR